MKFNKSDSSKFVGTALPILLVCFLFNSWVGCCHTDDQQISDREKSVREKNKPQSLASEMISWTKALDMQTQYSDPKITPRPFQLLVGGKFVVLKEFHFDAEQLAYIIYQYGAVPIADYVMFYFGTDGKESDGATDEPKMHLIAVGGKDKDQELILPNKSGDYSNINKCWVVQADINSPNSNWIPWTQAVKMKAEYLNGSKNSHFIKNKEGDCFTVLQGFKFKADQLSDIIYANKSPLGSSADHVILYFGTDGTDVAGGVKEPIMHLIAVGMNGKKLLLPDPGNYNDATKSSISDHADPCPGPGCPY